jgi:hypothetical protein
LRKPSGLGIGRREFIATVGGVAAWPIGAPVIEHIARIRIQLPGALFRIVAFGLMPSAP